MHNIFAILGLTFCFARVVVKETEKNLITKEEKAKLIKKFGGDVKNTGDITAQIAILTHEINSLTEHFQVNKKDLHSKRGFIAKIEKRKKLLTYLKNQDFEKYQNTIKQLGLRK